MSRFKFKPKIDQYGSLDLSDRGIESFEEIIEVFRNNELSSIESLSLQIIIISKSRGDAL